MTDEADIETHQGETAGEPAKPVAKRTAAKRTPAKRTSPKRKPKKPDHAAMLKRMSAMLERLLARMEAAEDDGAFEGKTAIDAVALTVRTLEKIDIMLRTFAFEADSDRPDGPTEAERAALVARVEDWIEERAQRRAAQLCGGSFASAAPERGGPAADSASPG